MGVRPVFRVWWDCFNVSDAANICVANGVEPAEEGEVVALLKEIIIRA
jgi:hypothetical protein